MAQKPKYFYFCWLVVLKVANIFKEHAVILLRSMTFDRSLGDTIFISCRTADASTAAARSETPVLSHAAANAGRCADILSLRVLHSSTIVCGCL